MHQSGCDLNVRLHWAGNEGGRQTHRQKSSAEQNIKNIRSVIQRGILTMFNATQLACWLACVYLWTHFTMRVGVRVQCEGHRGAQLSGQTWSQVLRHRQDPQAVRKSSFALCATTPSQRGGERHGGGGGGGEQHRAALALTVAGAIVPVRERKESEIQNQPKTLPLFLFINTFS